MTSGGASDYHLLCSSHYISLQRKIHHLTVFPVPLLLLSLWMTLTYMWIIHLTTNFNAFLKLFPFQLPSSVATTGLCQYSGLFYFKIPLIDNTTTYQPPSSSSISLMSSLLGQTVNICWAATSCCNDVRLCNSYISCFIIGSFNKHCLILGN